MISQGLNPAEPDLRAVEAAVKRATTDIALTHARAGLAIPVARDGGVAWVLPDELLEECKAAPAPAHSPTSTDLQ